MGTNTLTTRVDGLAIVVDWFNDIKSLLCVDFVPRAITGIPTDEAGSLGSSLYRWKDLYLSGACYVKGVDISQITSEPKDPHRIISGKALTSGKPDILAIGALLTATFQATATACVCMINSVQKTFSTDLTFTGLTAAPSSNNTCLINDPSLCGQAVTKTLGEWDGLPIVIDTIGSAITALNGTIAAFQTGTSVFLALVDTTNNKLWPIYRGFAGTARGTLSDNATITLLKLNTLLLKSDGIIKVSSIYYPESVTTAPGPGSAGKVYYERDTGKIAYDDGSTMSREYLVLGYVICDSTHSLYVECCDFDMNWRDNMNIRLSIKDTTTVTVKKNSFANVAGEYISFIKDVDATQAGNMEAGESIAANTVYYLYLSNSGTIYFSTKAPRACQYPKRGWYHPEQYYRCIGQVSTDTASFFTKLSGGVLTEDSAASAIKTGLITAEQQTIAGQKTFSDTVVVKNFNLASISQKSSGLLEWSGKFYEKYFSVLSIGVGAGPYGMAFAPTVNKIYVANSTDGTVTVLNPETNAVSATVTVGTLPGYCIYCPSNDRVYIQNQNSSNVTVLNPQTNAILATVTVGANQKQGCYAPTVDKIFIPNWGSDTISVIDCVNNTVVATVALTYSVYGSSYCPSSDRVYISYAAMGQVLVLNPTTYVVQNTITVGTQPADSCYCPTQDRIYISNSGSNNVSVIDCKNNTVIATIAVGTTPYAIAYDPGCDRIFVRNGGSSNISVINPSTNTLVTTLAVTGGNFCFHPRTNRLYISDNGSSGTVKLLNRF
jgi:YVTN family beta-propeller protein